MRNDTTQTNCSDINPIYLLGEYWINDKFSYTAKERTLYDRKNTLKTCFRYKTAMVFEYLLRHNNSIVSDNTLLNDIWKTTYVSKNVISQSIREIRTALEDKHRMMVVTISNRGYMLQAEVGQLTNSEPIKNRSIEAVFFPKPLPLSRSCLPF